VTGIPTLIQALTGRAEQSLALPMLANWNWTLATWSSVSVAVAESMGVLLVVTERRVVVPDVVEFLGEIMLTVGGTLASSSGPAPNVSGSTASKLIALVAPRLSGDSRRTCGGRSMMIVLLGVELPSHEVSGE